MNIGRRQTVEKGDIETETGQAAGGEINIDTTNVVSKDVFQRFGLCQVVIAIGMVDTPLVGHPIEQRDQKYPRSATWIEIAQSVPIVSSLYRNIDGHFSQKAWGIEGAGLSLLCRVFVCQKLLVNGADGFYRNEVEIVGPETEVVLYGTNLLAVEKMPDLLNMERFDEILFRCQILIEHAAVEIFLQLTEKIIQKRGGSGVVRNLLESLMQLHSGELIRQGDNTPIYQVADKENSSDQGVCCLCFEARDFGTVLGQVVMQGN